MVWDGPLKDKDSMTSGYLLNCQSLFPQQRPYTATYNVPWRNHSILPALLGSEAVSFSIFSTSASNASMNAPPMNFLFFSGSVTPFRPA